MLGPPLFINDIGINAIFSILKSVGVSRGVYSEGIHAFYDAFLNMDEYRTVGIVLEETKKSCLSKRNNIRPECFLNKFDYDEPELNFIKELVIRLIANSSNAGFYFPSYYFFSYIFLEDPYISSYYNVMGFPPILCCIYPCMVRLNIHPFSLITYSGLSERRKNELMDYINSKIYLYYQAVADMYNSSNLNTLATLVNSGYYLFTFLGIRILISSPMICKYLLEKPFYNMYHKYKEFIAPFLDMIIDNANRFYDSEFLYAPYIISFIKSKPESNFFRIERGFAFPIIPPSPPDLISRYFLERFYMREHNISVENYAKSLDYIVNVIF